MGDINFLKLRVRGVRAFGKGRIVAVGDSVGLSPALLNRLARDAGGYVPAGSGLQVDMNGDFASVHCLETGHYGFTAPDGHTMPLDLRAGESRWLDLCAKKEVCK